MPGGIGGLAALECRLCYIPENIWTRPLSYTLSFHTLQMPVDGVRVTNALPIILSCCPRFPGLTVCITPINTTGIVFREAGPASEIPPADRRQILARDSCSTFLYYATGSRRCSGVLVKIELASRHDLFMLLWNLFSPVADRVTVEVALGDDDIEPMVFAIARKRDVKKLLQDAPHLQDYAGVTRAPSLLPLGLVGLSETSALMDLMLQPAAIKTLCDYPGLLELMHVTDQNEEPILGQEETPRKALRIAFRLPAGSGDGTAKGGGGGSGEGGTKMIELALYYIELLNK